MVKRLQAESLSLGRRPQIRLKSIRVDYRDQSFDRIQR